MGPVCVVTTASSVSIDSAEALRRTVLASWPEAEFRVLASQRIKTVPSQWDVTPADLVHETPYVASQVLVEQDILALALPSFLSSLLELYDACLYLGPGLLMIRRPDELIAAAKNRGTALVVPATVTPVYSLTPALGPIESGPFLPDTRAVAVTRGSRALLEDWTITARQSVLDVDQRPVSWACDTFLQRLISRADVEVEGQASLLHWADFASVEVNRATGPAVALIAADELFESARERESDDPEVAWSMLVHRVHDSRPVEPHLRLIQSCQDLRESVTEETLLDKLRAAIWRAADPLGHRWGAHDRQAFDSWLYEVNNRGCTRLADFVVKSDSELSRQFFQARFDPADLEQWLDDGGRVSLGFDPLDATYEPRPARYVERSTPSPTLNALAWRWNTIKSLIPGYTRMATRRLEREYLGPDPREERGLAPPQHVDVDRQPPLWGESERKLNLIGPFRSESGLGQAARASLEAIRVLSLPFTHIDTTEKYPSRNSVDVGLSTDTWGQIGDINLIHSNADEMLTLGEGAFKHRFGGRFNAAMWFWETADLPRRSRPAFHLVDELWVASRYQRDVFGQYARVPIHVVGLAADLPAQRRVDRAQLGWRPNDLVFLFVYDALSSYGRKNPRKAMDAFVSAFAPDFEDVSFILKVSNLNKFPASQKEILGLAEQFPAITVIDEYMAREDVMDLMAASDVYVSLHAAEGFGLTLLEAMALGTPVICTAYSGNMDFTNERNSWLVDFEMVEIDERTGPYPEGSVWASPKLDHATEVMRHVSDHRSEIEVRGRLAHADAVEAASLENYAQRLNAQLRRVL